MSLTAKPSACCTLVTQKLVVFSPVEKSYNCRALGKNSPAASSGLSIKGALACAWACLCYIALYRACCCVHASFQNGAGVLQSDLQAAHRCFMCLRQALGNCLCRPSTVLASILSLLCQAAHRVLLIMRQVDNLGGVRGSLMSTPLRGPAPCPCQALPKVVICAGRQWLLRKPKVW